MSHIQEGPLWDQNSPLNVAWWGFCVLHVTFFLSWVLDGCPVCIFTKKYNRFVKIVS
jgi:hypothetical protein